MKDRVTLISETDPEDVFVLRIVLPSEEDIDADRIGVSKPVALACIGRRKNEVVTWIGPCGVRAMRIVHIRKAVVPAVVS